MATLNSIKQKINDLIANSNTTTGSNSDNLTDCVNTLIAGYGQGGGTDTDFSKVTASHSDVLFGKNFYNNSGQLVIGSMPNRGDAGTTLTSSNRSYTIEQGYHSGSGTVSMPTSYYDTSGVTADPATVLEGAFFVDKDGLKIQGEIPVEEEFVEERLDSENNTAYFYKYYKQGFRATVLVYDGTKENDITISDITT